MKNQNNNIQNLRNTFGAVAFLSALTPTCLIAADAKPAESDENDKPNVLWIITDDHRADALECYNQATRGTKESTLGYVSSPELNKLAAEGVLFTRSYCNSPASAPSRTSMHMGMYPHHRGIYGYEYYHDGLDFTPLTLPELMAEAGYNTVAIGKMGVRYKTYAPKGQRSESKELYNVLLETKNHQKYGEADWYPEKVWGKSENAGSKYNFFYPDGSKRSYYYQRTNKPLTEEDKADMKSFFKDQDILLSYTGKGSEPKPKKWPNQIIGGESTNTTEYTTDGAIMRDYKGYLASEGKNEYKSLARKTVPALNGAQPQFHYLGHHFPHTPVLPPASFRDKFKDKKYKAPLFDEAEYRKMPAQMQNWYSKTQVDKMKPEERQQFIRDYYAFAAMGDSLIGTEVRMFKEFCKKNNKDYLIVIACGDHAWHLGEQGTCAKFAAYENSNHTAVIVVSSDKKKFPAGKVVSDFVEYVDFLPTMISTAGHDLNDKRFDYLDGYNLADVVSGEQEARDYVIGEIDAVCGPHAMIRSKDFMFGMRTRKNGGIPAKDKTAEANEEMRWALDAPLSEVDAILYDLRVDPLERNNVALDAKYRKLAEFMREKLGNIVLGDGRVEVDWKAKNSYKRSTFALGADDKKLEIPAKIIPTVKK